MKSEITTLYDITEKSMDDFWSKPDTLKNKMRNIQNWKEIVKLTPKEIAYCIWYKTISDKEMDKLFKYFQEGSRNVEECRLVDKYLSICDYIHTTTAPRHRNAADEIKYICERLKGVIWEERVTDALTEEIKQTIEYNAAVLKELDATFNLLQTKYQEIKDLPPEWKKIDALLTTEKQKVVTNIETYDLPYILENGIYSENKDYFDKKMLSIREEYENWMPSIKAYIIAFENWCARENILDFLYGSKIVEYINYVKLFYSKQYGEIVDTLPLYCSGYCKTICTPSELRKKAKTRVMLPDYYDIKPRKTEYDIFTNIFNSRSTI